jgi:hypothetical protein
MSALTPGAFNDTNNFSKSFEWLTGNLPGLSAHFFENSDSLPARHLLPEFAVGLFLLFEGAAFTKPDFLPHAGNFTMASESTSRRGAAQASISSGSIRTMRA